MSYLDSTISNSERAKALITVGTVQALLAAGIVAGLSITVTELVEEDGHVIASFIDEDVILPPPPPPDEAVPPEDTTAYTPPVAPVDRFAFERDNPIDAAVFDPQLPVRDETNYVPIPDIPTGSGIQPQPIPEPAPSFTPVDARPLNGPQGWISNADYPRRDLQRDNEGSARYLLVVGSDGRVDACEIVSSTGHRGLDLATCKLIQDRARFDPATNSSGETVVGSYSGSVTWQIPRR